MDVLSWLLDSDPAIRWQVLRDLTDAPADEVASERARVAREGWGARLLDQRDQDGLWAQGACFPDTAHLHRQGNAAARAALVESPNPAASDPVESARAHITDQPADIGTAETAPESAAATPDLQEPTGPPEPGPDDEHEPQPWTATYPSLDLLLAFGVDPAEPRVRETTDLISQNCLWEHAGQPYFSGEVEPCINGRTLRQAHYFGHAEAVAPIVERLLSEQLADGGWNCWAEYGAKRSSFHSTICVLEGLLAHERAVGGSDQVRRVRNAGEEYLLERHLFRRLSTGEVVKPSWLELSFPTQWYYDVLHALEHFREAGGTPDPRLGEALDVVRSKRQADGRWLLENTHPGDVHFELEDGDGYPSRWNTLRALRVLRWADAAA